MPFLDSELIATWWTMTDSTNPDSIRIFKDWREEQRQEIQPVPLLQADIGTHVMNVGGQEFVTTVESPVIIVTPGDSGFGGTISTVTGVFDLVSDGFDRLRDPILNQTYLDNGGARWYMEEATIDISEAGVNISLRVVSDVPGAFTPVYGLVPDFIGRVARFYDILFIVTDTTPTVHQIIEGKITIKGDIERKYFMGYGQAPYLAAQGYHVSGDITVLASPIDDSLAIGEQTPGTFAVQGYNATGIQIGDAQFSFGSTSLNSVVTKKLSAGQLTTQQITFECFARYQTPIV